MAWKAPLLAAVVALVCAAGAEAAGTGQPNGPKWLEFENLNSYPEYVFYLWPRDTDRGSPGNSSIQLREGRAVNLRTLLPDAVRAAGGVYVVAIPLKLLGGPFQPAKEEWLTSPSGGVLKSQPLADANRQVIAYEPDASRSIRYRVEVGETLKLVPIAAAETPAELALGGAISHWYCFVIPVAALMVVLWKLALQRRTPADAT